MVRTGKMTTIIFIRDKNNNGQEVSGYIDYAQKLRTEDFTPYFERKYKIDFSSTVSLMIYYRKRLLPKPTDLSYYNWETQLSTSNS